MLFEERVFGCQCLTGYRASLLRGAFITAREQELFKLKLTVSTAVNFCY